MTWAELKALGAQFGISAVAMLYAFYTGLIRLGRDYDKVAQERDEWKGLALKAMASLSKERLLPPE